MTQGSITPTETLEVVSPGPDALVLEATWQPGGKPPPPHLHPAQDERFEVLAGELHAEVGGVRHVLRAGDVLDVPRGAVHKMWCGDEGARARWVTTPAGRTLAWFTALHEARRDGAVGRDGMPPVRTMLGLLGAYDDVLQLAVGPRPLVRGAVRVLGRAPGS